MPRSLLFSATVSVRAEGILRDFCIIVCFDSRVLIHYLLFLPHDIGLIMWCGTLIAFQVQWVFSDVVILWCVFLLSCKGCVKKWNVCDSVAIV